MSTVSNPLITEKRLWYTCIGLLLVALFLNLWVQPVYLEEPRRAIVAMEMEENQNRIVPTLMGEYYYKKPPFFNWVLMLSATIFGDYQAWALRFPTVLSVLLSAFLLFWMGKRYVNLEFGRLLALLYPLSAGLLFYFSTLGEIDLFFALVSIASFCCIFHFYQKGQFYTLFLLCYLLGAVGTLTKGLPSIAFTGLTLFAWFWSEKQLMRLISLPHLMGLLLFASVTGAYLWAYHQYNPLSAYLHELLAESGGRTALGNSLMAFFEHLLVFPLDTLKDLLPGSLLVIFLFRKTWRTMVWENSWVRFAAIVFAANFLLYWLSPGARQRYIYMLYPFFLSVLIYFWQHRKTLSKRQTAILSVLSYFLVAVLALGSLALPFIPDLAFLPYSGGIAALAFMAFAGLLYAFWKKQVPALWTLILASLLARLLFDLTVLPQRAHSSNAQKDQVIAQELYAITGEQAVSLLEDSRISLSIIYYYNLISGQTLRRDYTVEAGQYYIVPKENFAHREALLEIMYNDEPYILIRF